MNRVILLTTSPRLSRGVWSIDIVSPDAAGAMIARASRENRCVNLITFEETLDVIYDVSGVSFPRHDSSPSATKHRTERIIVDPVSGDVFICVILKEKKTRLTANDFAWYTVTVTK